MPIYEYRCRSCRRNVSLFFRSVAAAAEPRCPNCGGTELERLFSRVVVRRGARSGAPEPPNESTENELGGTDWGQDPYGEESFPDFDDDTDPREIARWTRQMSAQMGEPLEPELDQALTDIERGADPEEAMERLEDAPLPEPNDFDPTE